MQSAKLHPNFTPLHLRIKSSPRASFCTLQQSSSPPASMWPLLLKDSALPSVRLAGERSSSDACYETFDDRGLHSPRPEARSSWLHARRGIGRCCEHVPQMLAAPANSSAVTRPLASCFWNRGVQTTIIKSLIVHNQRKSKEQPHSGLGVAAGGAFLLPCWG